MDPRLQQQLQQALIGAQPEDNSPEQMALAQALMQRGGLGDILALTGDRVIAPVGAAMGARVQKQREGLQKARGDALDRESSERLRQATIDAAKEGRLAREEFALAGRKET